MDLATAANLATTIAVLVAIALGILELRRGRQERRDQAALEILRAVQAQEIHQAASEILKLPNDVDPDVIRASQELVHAATLVHFAAEQFGSLVFEGVFDLHMLDRMNGGWIRDCWYRLRRWVEAERAEERRPNTGEWWEWLVGRLEADPDPSKKVGAQVFYRGRRRR